MFGLTPAPPIGTLYEVRIAMRSTVKKVKTTMAAGQICI